MVEVVVLLVVPVVALTLARRLANHPVVVFGRDLLVSAFVLYRFVFRLIRSVVRYVVGEVRTWSLSR